MKFIIICISCAVAAIGLFYAYRYATSASGTQDIESIMSKTNIHDTIYFRTKDVNGKISAIHDSGIKPSKLIKSKAKYNTSPNQNHSPTSNSVLLINTAKYEYVDGIEMLLDRPVEIAIGQNIYNLATTIKLDPKDIQTHKTYYTVTINDSTLWNLKQV